MVLWTTGAQRQVPTQKSPKLQHFLSSRGPLPQEPPVTKQAKLTPQSPPEQPQLQQLEKGLHGSPSGMHSTQLPEIHVF